MKEKNNKKQQSNNVKSTEKRKKKAYDDVTCGKKIFALPLKATVIRCQQQQQQQNQKIYIKYTEKQLCFNLFSKANQRLPRPQLPPSRQQILFVYLSS